MSVKINVKLLGLTTWGQLFVGGIVKRLLQPDVS